MDGRNKQTRTLDRLRGKIRRHSVHTQLRLLHLVDTVTPGASMPSTSWIAKSACALAGIIVKSRTPQTGNGVVIVPDRLVSVFAVAAVVPNPVVTFQPRQASDIDRILGHFAKLLQISQEPDLEYISHHSKTKTVLVSKSTAYGLGLAQQFESTIARTYIHNELDQVISISVEFQDSPEPFRDLLEVA